MNGPLTKDEWVVGAFTLLFAMTYRILDICELRIIPPKIAILVLMISVLYLFFNRIVKMLISSARNKGGYYDTVLTVVDELLFPLRRGHYTVYSVRYVDFNNHEHIKEIHSTFTLKSGKSVA